MGSRSTITPLFSLFSLFLHFFILYFYFYSLYIYFSNFINLFYYLSASLIIYFNLKYPSLSFFNKSLILLPSFLTPQTCQSFTYSKRLILFKFNFINNNIKKLFLFILKFFYIKFIFNSYKYKL